MAKHAHSFTEAYEMESDISKMETTKRRYKKEKIALQKRDGSCCFYCGFELDNDITLEHLIPLTSGGKNILSNMVLAHEECNGKMGFKPLNEKVEYVISKRREK